MDFGFRLTGEFIVIFIPLVNYFSVLFLSYDLMYVNHDYHEVTFIAII